MARVLAADRETTIGWTDADAGFATIYTCQPPMMRKLARHPLATLSARFTDERGRTTGEEWRIPVECIVIRPGRRRLSPAQKAALAKATAASTVGRVRQNTPRLREKSTVEPGRSITAGIPPEIVEERSR
jgi:hypothetical protein